MSVASATIGFIAIVVLGFARARLDSRARWRRAFALLAGVEILAIFVLLATLVIVGVTQIILRNAAQSGFLWADPLMRHIVLWLGVLGASLATARVRHINIDVFSRLLPERLRALRRTVVYAASAIAAYILGVASVGLVLDERTYGDIEFLGIHTWMLQVILPLAFFLIAYRFIAGLFLGREGPIGGAEL